MHRLCATALTQAMSVPVPEAAKDVLRAKILKNMLLEIARQKTPENG